MAISIVGTSTDNHGTTDPLVISHTTTAATKLLVVFISGSGSPIGTDTLTWDGVGMTRLGSEAQLDASGTEDPYASIWYVINPVAKTANISFQPLDVTPNMMSVGATNFDGVDTTTPFEANNTATGTSTSASVTMTVTTPGAWMIASVHNRGEATALTPSDQEIFENTGAGVAAAGYDDAGTTGSRAISWTGANDAWAIAGGVLKPAATFMPQLPKKVYQAINRAVTY